MFCPNCGKELSSDAKFCTHCGQKIHNSCAEQTSILSVDTKFSTPSTPENRTFKSKPIMKRVVQLIIAFIVLTIVVNGGYQIWLSVNFPGADKDKLEEDLLAGHVSGTVQIGDTFDQSDLATTPLKIVYTSNKLYYDKYDEPYVSIILDITCIAGKWKPEYQDIIFWLNGSAAFNQPSFEAAEIKRGETVEYTFTHPLISTSTQDVDMQLSFKCKTGTVVELHFLVNDVQRFFEGNIYSDDSYSNGANSDWYPPTLPPIDPNDPNAGIYSDYSGLYVNKEGFALEIGMTSSPIGYYARIYENLEAARNFSTPLVELGGGEMYFGAGVDYAANIAFTDTYGEVTFTRMNAGQEGNYTFEMYADPSWNSTNIDQYSQSTYYMVERYIDVVS